jgi:hypothetical protein
MQISPLALQKPRDARHLLPGLMIASCQICALPATTTNCPEMHTAKEERLSFSQVNLALLWGSSGVPSQPTQQRRPFPAGRRRANEATEPFPLGPKSGVGLSYPLGRASKDRVA